jgi:hypothetical protein
MAPSGVRLLGAGSPPPCAPAPLLSLSLVSSSCPSSFCAGLGPSSPAIAFSNMSSSKLSSSSPCFRSSTAGSKPQPSEAEARVSASARIRTYSETGRHSERDGDGDGERHNGGHSGETVANGASASEDSLGGVNISLGDVLCLCHEPLSLIN